MKRTKILFIIKNALLFTIGMLKSHFTGHAMKNFGLTLELTYRCNLKCIFCERWKDRDFYFLSVKHVKNIIHQSKKIGCFQISLTGGEPMVHPNFADILNFFTEMKQHYSINTNGLTIKRNRDSIIKNKKYLLSLNVSLHSDSPELHDKLVNTPGAFKKTIENINSIKNEVEVILCVTITPENIEHLEGICNLAQNLKVRVRYQPVHNDEKAMLAPEGKPDFSQWSYDSIYNKMSNLIRKGNFQSYEIQYMKMQPLFLKVPDFFYSLPCAAAGRFIYFINPIGDVFPCETRRDKLLGNIIKNDLRHIINSSSAYKWRKACTKGKQGCSCFYACVTPINILFGKMPILSILPTGWPVSWLWDKQIEKYLSKL